MASSQKMLKASTNELELVDFRILKKVGDTVYEGIYGVNVAKVKEIIKIPKLTELPGAPEFIEGIFDLRGVVIPVVNLAKWMGIEIPEGAKSKPRIVIAEFADIQVGFIVSEAKRIRRISWADIEPATFTASDGALDKGKITGVTKIENGDVLLILDFESIVQDLGLYHPDTEINAHIEKFTGSAMVLDDSLTARKIVKDALEAMGLRVHEATDGEDGLKKLEDMHTQGSLKDLRIIISDVEMPRMDGFHFAAKVKEDPRFKGLPIVFNSSISDQFAENKGFEAGGEGYLVKFDANKFVPEIARVINSHISL
jgi:two-component system chemotaxis response regulator CheV